MGEENNRRDTFQDILSDQEEDEALLSSNLSYPDNNEGDEHGDRDKNGSQRTGIEDAGYLRKLRSRYDDAKLWIRKQNMGIPLLVFSTFCNSIMVTTCKLLETDRASAAPIHPLQILFARMAITYACCLAYMWATKSVPGAPFGPPEIRKLLFLRGFVGFFGVSGLYYSLQYLSLSDAMAITYVIPMVTGFLAWVILHERYSLLEAGCGLISLAGVGLIAKPKFIFGKASLNTNGNEAVESSSTEKRLIGTMLGLTGVLGASGVYIILRVIGFNAHPLLSVSYFALTCVIVSTIGLIVIPGISFALPASGYQWTLFCLIGLFGFIMQFSLTAGIQRVKASKASLMSYIGMVFAIFWDIVIWSHFPGFLSMLGILIILSNAYIVVKFKPDKESLQGDIESNPSREEAEAISLDDIERK